MPYPSQVRRWTAVLAVSLLTLAPLPAVSHASTGDDGSSGSVAGAFMAIACGASARVAATVPSPIVVVVTVVSCAFAFVDAWVTPDKP
ncbi:MAG: hypothetical protein U0704_17835 [Candidatus Eisenbacteria bacterium]